jgi:hypothetical protein
VATKTVNNYENNYDDVVVHKEQEYEIKESFYLAWDGSPQSYKEALNDPYMDQWVLSMDSEFNSLMENSTWVLVPRPSNA